MNTSTLDTALAAPQRATFAGALRSEAIKITSVRSTGILLGINVVGGLLVSFSVGAFVTDEVLTIAEVGFYWTVVAAVLAAVSAVLMFTSEVQHGTQAPTIAARPNRTDTGLAKVAVATPLGAGFGVLGIVAGFGGASLSGIDAGELSTVPATCSWAVMYTALSAVLGLGLGMIVRHGAGAVAGLLVWGFVVENLLLVFIPAEIARYLPFFAGNHLLDLESDIDSPEAIAVALSRVDNVAVYATYAFAAFAIGLVILKRRDID